ncbi:MAG TPA: branched-chain amino acid ABC transporter permease [Nitriliruptoraceae bacterium]|nr:branched-chain amino acid ABC transporter permease [Nitriliruptoraceae bacterium]
MNFFLQALASGIALGTIYALLALGFVIIYRATDVVSFAQPALMVLGAWWTVYFATVIGWNFWGSVVLAAIIGAAMGAVIERLLLRPLVGRPPFSAVMVTIGLDIVLRVIADDLMGINQRSVGDPFGLEVIHIGEVVIPKSDLAAMAGSVLVISALLAFYRYTKYGLAMRASAFDQEAAMAQGIPVGRMYGLAWALAGAMAAIAGTFISMGNSSLSRSSWVFALRALPVIVLGGLDSIKGAIVGGLMIGVAERLVGAYQPTAAPWLGSGFELVVPYLVMVVVLLVKPYGLFGTEEVTRV